MRWQRVEHAICWRCHLPQLLTQTRRGGWICVIHRSDKEVILFIQEDGHSHKERSYHSVAALKHSDGWYVLSPCLQLYCIDINNQTRLRSCAFVAPDLFQRRGWLLFDMLRETKKQEDRISRSQWGMAVAAKTSSNSNVASYLSFLIWCPVEKRVGWCMSDFRSL